MGGSRLSGDDAARGLNSPVPREQPQQVAPAGGPPRVIPNTEARVKAVRGLQVIDASIMPAVVTGNLNAPVIMMAEKISDRIRGVRPLPPSDAPYYRANPASRG